jgi:hypothetical protein
MRNDAGLHHVARHGPARGCIGLQRLREASLSVAYTGLTLPPGEDPKSRRQAARITPGT